MWKIERQYRLRNLGECSLNVRMKANQDLIKILTRINSIQSTNNEINLANSTLSEFKLFNCPKSLKLSNRLKLVHFFEVLLCNYCCHLYILKST